MENFYEILIYVGLFVNTLGFLLMYVDKQRAIKHKWRISENTLMIVALLFGSLGVYLGMTVFRHKTKHFKFKFFVPLFIIVHVWLIIYASLNMF
jgi:uncharacterized membrane protein YsdA (DUF1294 family)